MFRKILRSTGFSTYVEREDGIRKNNFIEISKNLAIYMYENNFIRLLK